MVHERLRVTITRETSTVVVAFIGDLDVYAAHDARRHLNEAIDRAVAHSIDQVAIEAGGLRFCDSTGLSIIVRARTAARERGVRVTLRGITEPLQDLIRLAGLDALLSH